MMEKKAWKSEPLTPEDEAILEKIRSEFAARQMKDVQVEGTASEGQMIIFVVSPYFENIPTMHRMQGSYGLAEKVLDPEEYRRITFIGTFSPEEYKAVSAKGRGAEGEASGKMPLSQRGS